jgi:two-component system cell cycle response regulator
MSQLPTILIVDDEPLGQETLAALLDPLGYRLRFAGSGGEALRLAIATPPDLILLDVMMAGMDGFEVCRRLRAHAPLAEVPVIMITALDDRDSRLQGIEAGADDFISKPYNRVELRARVRTITRLNRYRRLVNERTKFEWVVDRSDQGYLIVARSGAIRYANVQARLYLGAPPAGSDREGTFLELAAQQYRLQPHVAWTDWVAQPAGDRSAARLLVRPASAVAESFILQIELLEMAPDPDPCYLVHLRDITASMNDQQSIWTFQSLVRHKLGTSLAQLMGGLRLIESLELAPADSPLTELFTIASHGAANLQANISAIFAYMETPNLTGQGRCALTVLQPLIAEVAAGLDIAPVRMDVDASCATPALELAISHGALGLILAELLANARKFHPAHCPTIAIAVTHAGGNIALCVCDDGAWLAPEQLARVWLPYYQGERYFTGQVPGMGLGLAMVASIIWRAGGACEIRNRAERPGVEVELTIPIAAAL